MFNSNACILQLSLRTKSFFFLILLKLSKTPVELLSRDVFLQLNNDGLKVNIISKLLSQNHHFPSYKYLYWIDDDNDDDVNNPGKRTQSYLYSFWWCLHCLQMNINIFNKKTCVSAHYTIPCYCFDGFHSKADIQIKCNNAENFSKQMSLLAPFQHKHTFNLDPFRPVIKHY